MYHIFFIHSSTNEWIGCFHVLAFVNCAAMNTGVPSFWIIIVLSRYMTRSKIAGLYSNSIFSLFFFFFRSTSLLLPTHLPPPSCTHAQSCNPMDFSPPDSYVHGFFQARILEWVAISFSIFLVFKGNSILFSIVAAPTYIPTNSVGGFNFSTPSPAFVICTLFNDGHSDQPTHKFLKPRMTHAFNQ